MCELCNKYAEESGDAVNEFYERMVEREVEALVDLVGVGPAAHTLRDVVSLLILKIQREKKHIDGLIRPEAN